MIFRPLLEVSKAETVRYCEELGRTYRQDSGNLLFRFTRNRVRRELMPQLAEEYNPRVSDALVRLANSSVLDLDFMEGELDRVWSALLVEQETPDSPAGGIPAVRLKQGVSAEPAPSPAAHGSAAGLCLGQGGPPPAG